MAKGEIVIHEELCKGCGLCAHFCSRGCIVTGDRLGPKGYVVPNFTNPDSCTACAVCAWLCPDFAIDVYEYVKAKES